MQAPYSQIPSLPTAIMPKRNKQRFDRDYAQLMINHPCGWALYKAPSSKDLRPGACGYFDAHGDWHCIVQLTDKASVKERGWKRVPSEKQMKVESDKGTIKWRPKISEHVDQIDLDFETGTQ
jgi:hypothetical protein